MLIKIFKWIWMFFRIGIFIVKWFIDSVVEVIFDHKEEGEEKEEMVKKIAVNKIVIKKKTIEENLTDFIRIVEGLKIINTHDEIKYGYNVVAARLVYKDRYSLLQMRKERINAEMVDIKTVTGEIFSDWQIFMSPLDKNKNNPSHFFYKNHNLRWPSGYDKNIPVGNYEFGCVIEKNEFNSNVGFPLTKLGNPLSAGELFDQEKEYRILPFYYGKTNDVDGLQKRLKKYKGLKSHILDDLKVIVNSCLFIVVRWVISNSGETRKVVDLPLLLEKFVLCRFDFFINKLDQNRRKIKIEGKNRFKNRMTSLLEILGKSTNNEKLKEQIENDKEFYEKKYTVKEEPHSKSRNSNSKSNEKDEENKEEFYKRREEVHNLIVQKNLKEYKEQLEENKNNPYIKFDMKTD
jgi:hypothetical protein